MAVFSWVVQIAAGASAAPAKRIKRVMQVAAGAGAGETRLPTQVAPVGVGVDVAFEHAAAWQRGGSAEATAAVALGPRRVKKIVRLAVGVRARVCQGADTVYSYLRLRSDALDLEGFLQATRHGPEGFADFVRVYPGEYTFKDAVVRSTMLTREVTTMPKLTRLKPIVDVPDRVLQGSAVVTDALAGVVLPFTPEFYAPPEVICMWQSGATVGVARFDAPTRASVRLYIEDPNNPGTMLTGTVSYAIKGY